MGTNLTTLDILPKPDNTLTIGSRQEYYEFRVKRTDVHSYLNVTNIKEMFYSEAINNLLKKSKFLQLYIQLIEEQITDEEYEQELNENSSEYFINMKEINSNIEFSALFSVLQNLRKDLAADDISEIFGIKTQSLMKNLNY